MEFSDIKKKTRYSKKKIYCIEVHSVTLYWLSRAINNLSSNVTWCFRYVIKLQLTYLLLVSKLYVICFTYWLTTIWLALCFIRYWEVLFAASLCVDDKFFFVTLEMYVLFYFLYILLYLILLSHVAKRYQIKRLYI